MRSKYNKELLALNSDLIDMGNAVEASIESAIEALKNGDADLAKMVLDSDNDIDDLEKSIENRSIKLLLQQQPVAGDLRVISSTLKIITDLERIGDNASDIADITLHMLKRDYTKNLSILPGMAEASIKMVRESINAYIKKDIDIVNKVIELDDVVDEYFAKLKIVVADKVKEGGDVAEEYLDFMMIGRYLERIGDHAENIAEWVYYAIVGSHYEKAPKEGKKSEKPEYN